MTDNSAIKTLCPNCTKPTAQEHRPFCSRRCANVDLGHWFNGSYAIEAVEPPDEWTGSSSSAVQDASGWKH